MTDYPTAANFLNPLPPYPIKQMCKAIDDPRHGNDQLEKLYAAVNIFYNYTGELSCFDMRIPHALLSIRWWTWQNIERVLESFGSNIIFFNGLRDPWSAGGVLKTISKSLVTIIAKEGNQNPRRDLTTTKRGIPMDAKLKEWSLTTQGVRKMDIKRPDAKCKYLGVEPSIGYLLPNPKKHHMLGNNSRQ
nr:lysosomal Pro-X carboxypeptidase-like [Ipomoea batatas]